MNQFINNKTSHGFELEKSMHLQNPRLSLPKVQQNMEQPIATIATGRYDLINSHYQNHPEPLIPSPSPSVENDSSLNRSPTEYLQHSAQGFTFFHPFTQSNHHYRANNSFVN